MGIYKLTASELLKHKKGTKLTYANNTNLYDTSGDHNEVYVPRLSFRKQVMNLLCNLSTFRGTIPEPEIVLEGTMEMWTGKQILSFIIPEEINLTQYNSSYDNEPVEIKHLVKVVEGVIQQGTFDKGLLRKLPRV